MDKKLQGKRNKRKGRDFEVKVRHELEEQGWTVSKWANNVEIIESVTNGKEIHINKAKLVSATKWRFNPFTKTIMAVGTGFPDFIAYRMSDNSGVHRYYEVIGVECKVGKYLTQEEKAKASWLWATGKFNRILVAYKDKKTKEIIYTTFEL